MSVEDTNLLLQKEDVCVRWTKIVTIGKGNLDPSLEVFCFCYS